MKERQTLNKILKKLKEYEKKYEEEGVIVEGVFGSFAREEADRFSDIDIVYRLDHTRFDRRYKGGFAKLLRLDHIRKEIENRLRRRVDLVPMTPSLLNRIKDQFVPL